MFLRHYEATGCEGLFLSSLTYQGLRLPVREIARALAASPRPSFVVVDGAQGFCHAPAELGSGYCDLFLAGTHKWLRAYHPMGVGFCGRPESADFIKRTCEGMMAEEGIDDALLHFTSRRERGVRERFTETVSLAPLFSCAAALAENLGSGPCPRKRFAELVYRARELQELSEGSAWAPLVPHPSLRSGILLLHSGDPAVQAESPESLRRHFQAQNLSLTAYENGIVRLSAPMKSLGNAERSAVASALGRVVSADSPETAPHYSAGCIA
jgi:hypothetical protein